MKRRRKFLATVIAGLLIGNGLPATAQDFVELTLIWPTVPSTVWKAELDTSGDWFDAELWTEGVPNAETDAYLVNHSEVLLNEGEAVVRLLAMQNPSYGRARMTQTGGQLTIENHLRIDDGIYRQVGGQLLANELLVGSYRLTLAGSNPDLTEVPRPETPCTINDQGLCIPDLVLLATEKRFQLEGGELEIGTEINVGLGHVDISGGRLQVPLITVDAFGNSSSDSGIQQSGGFVDVGGDLRIQDGTYALSGGELAVERLAMGDPALDSPLFIVSSISRASRFEQTGGELNVSGNLEMCVPGFIWPLPTEPSFTEVTYRMQAGTVMVEGDTIVGSLGVAPAQFLQSGGSHRTVGELRIEGAESMYELSGGELHVGSLSVGTNVFNVGGAFSLAAGAEMLVDSLMTLGPLAEVTATPNSQIQLDGGDLEIQGNEAQLLAGLENISLLVTDDSVWSTLEAASADLGGVPSAFQNNFAWDDLLIGDGSAAGQLKLIDDYVNQIGVNQFGVIQLGENQSGENQSGTEAVYVDRLVVTAGSSLDLNGINLYYREADIAGQVITSGGGALYAVPEPTTLGLLLLAAACCRFRVGSRLSLPCQSA